MLEPPNLTDDEILARVRRRFGLEVSTATFMPEGNDSWAWAFRLDGDGSWFLTMWTPQTRSPINQDANPPASNNHAAGACGRWRWTP